MSGVASHLSRSGEWSSLTSTIERLKSRSTVSLFKVKFKSFSSGRSTAIKYSKYRVSFDVAFPETSIISYTLAFCFTGGYSTRSRYYFLVIPIIV